MADIRDISVSLNGVIRDAVHFEEAVNILNKRVFNPNNIAIAPTKSQWFVWIREGERAREKLVYDVTFVEALNAALDYIEKVAANNG